MCINQIQRLERRTPWRRLLGQIHFHHSALISISLLQIPYLLRITLPQYHEHVKAGQARAMFPIKDGRYIDRSEQASFAVRLLRITNSH